MKFDWSKLEGASVSQQIIWLRAWEAQLQAFLKRQRDAQTHNPSVCGEIVLLQRERLKKEICAVAAAAEANAEDLPSRLSSLRIAIGCQQLLEGSDGCGDLHANVMRKAP